MKRVLVLLALLLARPALAQPGAGEELGAASNAIAAGDYERAIELAGAVAARETAAKADFAEAHRLLGLAWYFEGDTVAAEREFLAYLKLDLDGRLDPTQAPPEAVAFFEDVRARHAAELRKLRPRQRRYAMLNLLPPGGQIQNKERTKAWVIGGLELALAATHLTTFFMLQSMCDPNDLTCDQGGSQMSDTTTARRLRTANYVSGFALIGVWVYGVIDGYHGFKKRKRDRERQTVVTAEPVEGGMVAGVSVSF